MRYSDASEPKVADPSFYAGAIAVVAILLLAAIRVGLEHK